MAKEFESKVIEVISPLADSDKSWGKYVLKMQWGDNMPSVDIRNVCLAQNKFGKGISLTDEEVDELVDILVDKDYGSLDVLEKAIKRKRDRISFSKNVVNAIYDEDKVYITYEED